MPPRRIIHIQPVRPAPGSRGRCSRLGRCTALLGGLLVSVAALTLLLSRPTKDFDQEMFAVRRSVPDPLPRRRISSDAVSLHEHEPPSAAKTSHPHLKRPRSRQPVVYVRPVAESSVAGEPLVKAQGGGTDAAPAWGSTLPLSLLSTAGAAQPVSPAVAAATGAQPVSTAVPAAQPTLPAAAAPAVTVATAPESTAAASESAGHVCDYSYLLDAEPPVVESRGPGGATLKYAPWRMRWPRFIRPKHREWWAQYEVVAWRRAQGCDGGDGWLLFCEDSYTRGRTSLLTDVIMSDQPGHDCGPRGDVTQLVRQPGHAVVASVDVLLWAVIPATWTHQHWWENTLPKLAQLSVAHPELDLPSWRNITADQELLLDRYPIVKRIYDHLHMGVVDLRSPPQGIHAKQALYSCNTPPLHPYLWQQGQSAWMGVKRHVPLEERKTIVYCGRSLGRIENDGRNVLNEADVLPLLRAYEGKRGLRVVQFDHTKHPTLESLFAFFGGARMLIGPHGGCLTNVNYMSCGSTLVEVMPLVGGVRPPVGHPAMMMYMQAAFLGVDYWMHPVLAEDGLGNMRVPLDELREILEQALGPP